MEDAVLYCDEDEERVEDELAAHHPGDRVRRPRHGHGRDHAADGEERDRRRNAGEQADGSLSHVGQGEAACPHREPGREADEDRVAHEFGSDRAEARRDAAAGAPLRLAQRERERKDHHVLDDHCVGEAPHGAVSEDHERHRQPDIAAVRQAHAERLQRRCLVPDRPGAEEAEAEGEEGDRTVGDEEAQHEGLAERRSGDRDEDKRRERDPDDERPSAPVSAPVR
jgi:hypothetical protein